MGLSDEIRSAQIKEIEYKEAIAREKEARAREKQQKKNKEVDFLKNSVVSAVKNRIINEAKKIPIGESVEIKGFIILRGSSDVPILNNESISEKNGFFAEKKEWKLSLSEEYRAISLHLSNELIKEGIRLQKSFFTIYDFVDRDCVSSYAVITRDEAGKRMKYFSCEKQIGFPIYIKYSKDKLNYSVLSEYKVYSESSTSRFNRRKFEGFYNLYNAMRECVAIPFSYCEQV